MILRDFDEKRDWQGLAACVIELQDAESALDSRFPDGASIVDAYIPDILERCRKHNGKIIVAEVDGAIAGYAMIWASQKGEDIEEGDFETARLADLAVLAEYRKRGIGKALLEAAEDFAREQGATSLHIGVMAANQGALRLYRSCGYEAFAMRLEKHL